jgi:hypothetical protein
LWINPADAAHADGTTFAGNPTIASGTLGAVALVGLAVALVGLPFALVGLAFALVGIAVPMVGVAVAVVGEPLTVVGDSFAQVGLEVAPVGGLVAFVGDPFTFVGVTVPLVGVEVALVGLAVTPISDLITFVGGAHTFSGLDASQFVKPATSVGRDTTHVRHPTSVFGGALSFVGGSVSLAGGVFSLAGGAGATRGGFTSVDREELASLRCSPSQPCRERTCLGSSLPKGQGDSQSSGGFARFAQPTVVSGRHISESTPTEGTGSYPRRGHAAAARPLAGSEGLAGGLVRREALLIRVEVEDLCRWVVAAAW